VNKQAALNTFLIVTAACLVAGGLWAMMIIDPVYTLTGLACFGFLYLIKMIYDIEKGRIDSRRLTNIDREYQ